MRANDKFVDQFLIWANHPDRNTNAVARRIASTSFPAGKAAFYLARKMILFLAWYGRQTEIVLDSEWSNIYNQSIIMSEALMEAYSEDRDVAEDYSPDGDCL